MTRYRLELLPQAVIPPEIEVGVMLRKYDELAAAIANLTTRSPARVGGSDRRPRVPNRHIPEQRDLILPSGTDHWYDVFYRSYIPFAAYQNVFCADTDNTEFHWDDAVTYEGNMTGILGQGEETFSAWWVITIPWDIKECWLTADTWASTGAETATRPTDTNLMILTATDGMGSWPLTTPSRGGVFLDFDTLSVVASSDDDPDPADPARPFTSKVTNAHLLWGQTYFIRVDVWNQENIGTIYRLRLSISLTAP